MCSRMCDQKCKAAAEADHEARRRENESSDMEMEQAPVPSSEDNPAADWIVQPGTVLQQPPDEKRKRENTGALGLLPQVLYHTCLSLG